VGYLSFPFALFCRIVSMDATADAHHDRMRCSWALAPQGKPAVVHGTASGCAAASRLQTITGCFAMLAVGSALYDRR
jgi:hypothetical protein